MQFEFNDKSLSIMEWKNIPTRDGLSAYNIFNHILLYTYIDTGNLFFLYYYYERLN